MYGLTIWKSGIWLCKKKINIEKIAFKFVQIKFLAMNFYQFYLVWLRYIDLYYHFY